MNDQKKDKDKDNAKKDLEKSEVKKLNEDLANARKQTEEFKNKYLRALADYQNLEKRVNTDREMNNQQAVASVLLKFLPALDNLEKAMIFVKDSGLKIVKEHLEKTLTDLGLEEINLAGKPFDPHLAEAIDMVEGKQNDIVVEVLRKGYLFKNRVIRPAQVKVSKKT